METVLPEKRKVLYLQAQTFEIRLGSSDVWEEVL